MTYKASTMMRTRNWERGSPCVRPISTAYYSEGEPIKIIKSDTDERQDRTHFHHFGPKHILDVMLRRNFQLTLSKAWHMEVLILRSCRQIKKTNNEVLR